MAILTKNWSRKKIVFEIDTRTILAGRVGNRLLAVRLFSRIRRYLSDSRHIGAKNASSQKRRGETVWDYLCPASTHVRTWKSVEEK